MWPRFIVGLTRAGHCGGRSPLFPLDAIAARPPSGAAAVRPRGNHTTEHPIAALRLDRQRCKRSAPLAGAQRPRRCRSRLRFHSWDTEWGRSLALESKCAARCPPTSQLPSRVYGLPPNEGSPLRSAPQGRPNNPCARTSQHVSQLSVRRTNAVFATRRPGQNRIQCTRVLGCMPPT